uniref:SET domain-containing protein n=1 Tax=Timema shepardi TaxID=629360 RepID=A0A7R9G2N6_TIMSH|nr:unnamed protein product [Timema shepardi]
MGYPTNKSHVGSTNKTKTTTTHSGCTHFLECLIVQFSDYSNVKQDKLRMEHLTALSVVLTEFIGESNMPNSAELMAMYGRMSVNSFNILDPEMLSVGTGIYLGASIIDHSCDPNAVAVFQGTTIFIRTLRDIPALDWDKVNLGYHGERRRLAGTSHPPIFISYIDLLNFPQERRKELQQTYYFLCECRRCNDVEELAGMSSVVCPNQECRAPVPVPTHVRITSSNNCAIKHFPVGDRPCCLTCGAIVSDEMHQEYLEVAEFTQDQLNVMNNIAYLDVCKVCLKKQSGIFHKQDMVRARVVDLAFESSIEMGQFPLAREYGEELVSSYRSQLDTILFPTLPPLKCCYISSELYLPGSLHTSKHVCLDCGLLLSLIVDKLTGLSETLCVDRKYYGPSHPLLGLLHLKLAKLLLYLEESQEAVTHARLAQKVLKVTHGEDHSLYRGELAAVIQQCE